MGIMQNLPKCNETNAILTVIDRIRISCDNYKKIRCKDPENKTMAIVEDNITLLFNFLCP